MRLMARDDWRLRVELPEANGLLDRLRGGLGSEARELAQELEEHRRAVTHDVDSVCVYAASLRQAEQAQAVLEAELRELRLEPRLVVIEHWLADEERWDSDAPGPDDDDETLARGYAPWEVRVSCRSVDEARKLASRLEGEGYGVDRQWRHVLAGAASREDADALARRVQGDVEPGGELVWEVAPRNPFALVLGGLGG
jgi:hypothetical protein